MSGIYKNGEWYDGGSTDIYNNPIIINDQDNIDQFIKEFTTVNYVKGNRVGYNKEKTSDIICNGYLWHASVPIANGELQYDIDYNKVINEEGEYSLFLSRVDPNQYTFKLKTPSGINSASPSSPIGICGITLKWNSIYPPDEIYPYGYTRGFLYVVDYNNLNQWSANLKIINMGFSSKAEYESAIGLIYNPLEV